MTEFCYAKEGHVTCSPVIDYAKAKEYFEGDNPAAWKGMLKPFLPQPGKV